MRLTLAEGQSLQHDIMGYLPGFATPRMVCDVPYVGKRRVHPVMLPESGRAWWRAQGSRPRVGAAEAVRLAGSGGSARQDAV